MAGCRASLSGQKPAMILSGVTFTTGKAELTHDSLTILDNVAASLHAWPEATIEIQGHTDNVGGESYNEKLGLQRAGVVKEYLAKAGIPIFRMETISYGESAPVADNASREGRAANRRVVLVVLQ